MSELIYQLETFFLFLPEEAIKNKQLHNTPTTDKFGVTQAAVLIDYSVTQIPPFMPKEGTKHINGEQHWFGCFLEVFFAMQAEMNF